VHKDAVSPFQRNSKGAENATLKVWAGSTLPTLQQHLDMAEKPAQVMLGRFRGLPATVPIAAAGGGFTY
jgi:hypothetical protein